MPRKGLYSFACMHLLFTIGGTVIAWAIVLGTLFLLRHAPRTVFVVAHYSIDIGAFGVLVHLLRKMGISYSVGKMMLVILGTLLVLELFYWGVVNPVGAMRYLTVVDWIIPLILVIGTIYIVALFSR